MSVMLCSLCSTLIRSFNGHFPVEPGLEGGPLGCHFPVAHTFLPTYPKLIPVMQDSQERTLFIVIAAAGFYRPDAFPV